MNREDYIEHYRNAVTAYENDVYIVKVGFYPEEDLKVYVVINKEFEVVEYAHSILHFAITWADNFAKVMQGERGGSPEIDALPDLEIGEA